MPDLGKTAVGAEVSSMNGTRAHTLLLPAQPGMVLESVSLYLGANNGGNVRAAVYVGGTATSPDGATLVADLGTIAVTGRTAWRTQAASGTPGLAPGGRLWLAVKFPPSIPADAYFDVSSDLRGDWDASGRYTSAAIDPAESVAFPAAWPTDTGTFRSGIFFSWYVTCTAAADGPSGTGWLSRRIIAQN